MYRQIFAAVAVAALMLVDPAGRGSTAVAEPLNASGASLDPVDALGDANTLASDIKARFGDRFAYIEIDRAVAAAPLLRVGVVDATAADAFVAAAISPAIRVVRAPVSEHQLELWEDAVGALMVGKGVNLMLLPDRPAGTLTLLADDLTAEQVAEFRAAVPPGVLDVKVDTSFAYDLDHLTREELPYEAGLHLTVAPAHIPPGLIGPRDGGLRTTPDSHEGNCTSAFWGQWSDGIDTFNYGITAGHCGNTGTDSNPVRAAPETPWSEALSASAPGRSCCG